MPSGRQMGHGLLHGVAGAQLRFLAHKLQIKMGCSARESSGSRFYFCSTVAGDDDGAAGLQVGCLIQHMVQQRAPGQALQHLGVRLFMRVPLPSRHDENVEWSHESKSVGGRSGQPPRGCRRLSALACHALARYVNNSCLRFCSGRHRHFCVMWRRLSTALQQGSSRGGRS